MTVTMTMTKNGGGDSTATSALGELTNGFFAPAFACCWLSCTQSPAKTEPAAAQPSLIKVDVKAGRCRSFSPPVQRSSRFCPRDTYRHRYSRATRSSRSMRPRPGPAAICSGTRRQAGSACSRPRPGQSSGQHRQAGPRQVVWRFPAHSADGAAAGLQANPARRSLRRLSGCPAFERGIQKYRRCGFPPRPGDRAAAQVQRQHGGQEGAALRHVRASTDRAMTGERMTS